MTEQKTQPTKSGGVELSEKDLKKVPGGAASKGSVNPQAQKKAKAPGQILTEFGQCACSVAKDNG